MPCRVPRGRILLGLAALALLVAHRPLLSGFAGLFRSDDPPARSDALVLLLGGERDRAEKVAELYRKGLAPLVLVGSDPDLELNRGFLTSRGVPTGAILSLGPTIGTRGEASRVRDYVRTHPVRRLTVVTTAFHTARARRIFSKVLSGTGVEVRMAATRDPRFDESDWFLNEVGRSSYLTEAIKVLYYRLAYEEALRLRYTPRGRNR